MKRAICLPYCVDQNEPSKPINRIVDLPDNVVLRDTILKKLFNEHVCEVDEDDIELDERQGEEVNYGDIILSYDGSVFMYVTFVEG